MAKEIVDDKKHPIKFSGTISMNTNGIAPVPAFTYGKPVVSANLSVVKNRFSYDPQFSYGFDLRPWIMDNWFHYKLMDRPKFEMRTGLNISMFFSEYESPDADIWQGQRYTTFELAEIFKVTETSTISFLTWYDYGLEDGTISGYFLNLVGDKSDIRLGNHFLAAINFQTFYVDYTGKNDGLFIAPMVSCASVDVPFYIFFQGIQPIITNISPSPEFQWNLGIGFSFD